MLPLKTPYLERDSTAYSEQVGVKRQDDGKWGEMVS